MAAQEIATNVNDMTLRIVLMGTGEFAIPAFRALMESRHEVVGVLTQPDKVGRGHHRHINPVKELANEHSIPVLQPERVNQAEILNQLRAFSSDVFIVAAYGQILKPELLAIPRLGAFNLHGSLLPRHRGAAPVQYSIWRGDRQTGVTIFQIEPSLDSGPMIGKIATDILPEETSGELMLRLAELSVPLTLSCCDKLDAGTADFEVQDAVRVTLAPKIEKEAGIIDWSQSAQRVACQVRAMQPWPRASSWLQIQDHSHRLRCIVLKARPLDVSRLEDDAVMREVRGGFDGRITVIDQRIFVNCGTDSDTVVAHQNSDIHLHDSKVDSGTVEILSIQPEGKRAMDAVSFINGHAIRSGARFVSIP